MRRDLNRLFGKQQGPTLDALGNSTKDDHLGVVELFDARSPARARVRLDHNPALSDVYLDRLRGYLVRKATQSHHFKFAAAIHEESAWIDPRWKSRILAPALTYLPTNADPDTEVLRRSEHALKLAGVL